VKRVVFILILLSLCGINNTHAAFDYTFSWDSFSALNKFENSFEQNLSDLHLSTVDSEKAGSILCSKKWKKRKKAIQPTLVYFADEQYFKIIDFKVTSPYFLETLYSFCPYFGDDERGPPVIFIVS
jgi:hypothetical protein